MNRIIRPVCLLLTFLLLLIASPLQGSAREEQPVLRTAAQLEQQLTECMKNVQSEITLPYAESLHDEIESGEIFNRLFNSSYGIRCSEWKYSWAKRGSLFEGTLNISLRYTDGMEIVRAWRNGNLASLTQPQRQTFEAAVDIVRRETRDLTHPLQIERALHDALCRRVTYTRSTAEDGAVQDSAVGALLYGQAECDGYSDAFYLLCSLAGLNVGFQDGTAYSDGVEGPHLWNVIELNGQWYHVDVTWDDIDDPQNPDIIRYAYFNVGDDLIGAHHFFDKTISARSTSPVTDWNYFFYTWPDTVSDDAAYFATPKDAAKYIKSRHNAGAQFIHVMVDGNYSSTDALHEAMIALPVYGSWMTWYTAAGPFTAFEVYFRE